jgi:hypothetical protein
MAFAFASHGECEQRTLVLVEMETSIGPCRAFACKMRQLEPMILRRNEDPEAVSSLRDSLLTL